MRKVILGGVLAALALSGAAPTAHAAKLDQRCEREAKTYEFRAGHTVSQSFVPGGSAISGVAVRLAVVDQYVGPITARLVARPAGDLRDPTAGPNATYQSPGVTISEATVQLDSRKWPPTRFRNSWVMLPLTAPATAPPTPLVGTYSIDIDFPLDHSFKPYGAHIGWSVCDGDYQRGAAFAIISPNMLNRSLADIGSPSVPAALPAHPSIGVRYTAVSDFEFRVYSGD